MHAKAAGDVDATEKAAARLKVNSADAKEAGRLKRATMVTYRGRLYYDGSEGEVAGSGEAAL